MMDDDYRRNEKKKDGDAYIAIVHQHSDSGLNKDGNNLKEISYNT